MNRRRWLTGAAAAALGAMLATCGFAFVEPVLSEHLINTLKVNG